MRAASALSLLAVLCFAATTKQQIAAGIATIADHDGAMHAQPIITTTQRKYGGTGPIGLNRQYDRFADNSNLDISARQLDREDEQSTFDTALPNESVIEAIIHAIFDTASLSDELDQNIVDQIDGSVLGSQDLYEAALAQASNLYDAERKQSLTKRGVLLSQMSNFTSRSSHDSSEHVKKSDSAVSAETIYESFKEVSNNEEMLATSIQNFPESAAFSVLRGNFNAIFGALNMLIVSIKNDQRPFTPDEVSPQLLQYVGVNTIAIHDLVDSLETNFFNLAQSCQGPFILANLQVQYTANAVISRLVLAKFPYQNPHLYAQLYFDDIRENLQSAINTYVSPAALPNQCLGKSVPPKPAQSSRAKKSLASSIPGSSSSALPTISSSSSTATRSSSAPATSSSSSPGSASSDTANSSSADSGSESVASRSPLSYSAHSSLPASMPSLLPSGLSPPLGPTCPAIIVTVTINPSLSLSAPSRRRSKSKHLQSVTATRVPGTTLNTSASQSIEIARQSSSRIPSFTIPKSLGSSIGAGNTSGRSGSVSRANPVSSTVNSQVTGSSSTSSSKRQKSSASLGSASSSVPLNSASGNQSSRSRASAASTPSSIASDSASRKEPSLSRVSSGSASYSIVSNSQPSLSRALSGPSNIVFSSQPSRSRVRSGSSGIIFSSQPSRSRVSSGSASSSIISNSQPSLSIISSGSAFSSSTASSQSLSRPSLSIASSGPPSSRAPSSSVSRDQALQSKFSSVSAPSASASSSIPYNSTLNQQSVISRAYSGSVSRSVVSSTASSSTGSFSPASNSFSSFQPILSRSSSLSGTGLFGRGSLVVSRSGASSPSIAPSSSLPASLSTASVGSGTGKKTSISSLSISMSTATGGISLSISATLGTPATLHSSQPISTLLPSNTSPPSNPSGSCSALVQKDSIYVDANGYQYLLQCNYHYGQKGSIKRVARAAYQECFEVCDRTKGCSKFSYKNGYCHLKNTKAVGRVVNGVDAAVRVVVTADSSSAVSSTHTHGSVSSSNGSSTSSSSGVASNPVQSLSTWAASVFRVSSSVHSFGSSALFSSGSVPASTLASGSVSSILRSVESGSSSPSVSFSFSQMTLSRSSSSPPTSSSGAAVTQSAEGNPGNSPSNSSATSSSHLPAGVSSSTSSLFTSTFTTTLSQESSGYGTSIGPSSFSSQKHKLGSGSEMKHRRPSSTNASEGTSSSSRVSSTSAQSASSNGMTSSFSNSLASATSFALGSADQGNASSVPTESNNRGSFSNMSTSTIITLDGITASSSTSTSINVAATVGTTSSEDATSSGIVASNTVLAGEQPTTESLAIGTLAPISLLAQSLPHSSSYQSSSDQSTIAVTTPTIDPTDAVTGVASTPPADFTPYNPNLSSTSGLRLATYLTIQDTSILDGSDQYLPTQRTVTLVSMIRPSEATLLETAGPKPSTSDDNYINAIPTGLVGSVQNTGSPDQAVGDGNNVLGQATAVSGGNAQSGATSSNGVSSVLSSIWNAWTGSNAANNQLWPGSSKGWDSGSVSAAYGSAWTGGSWSGMQLPAGPDRSGWSAYESSSTQTLTQKLMAASSSSMLPATSVSPVAAMSSSLSSSSVVTPSTSSASTSTSMTTTTASSSTFATSTTNTASSSITTPSGPILIGAASRSVVPNTIASLVVIILFMAAGFKGLLTPTMDVFYFSEHDSFSSH